MGLAHRVIPTILCRGRALVKGERFNAWRTVGVAATAVRIHAARGVDEVCLLDIGATPEGRGPDLSLVRELSEVLFVPLAVGGGVRSLADVRALLAAGADKVVIGEAAFCQDDLVGRCTDAVGCQAIVVALNVDRDSVVMRGRTVFVGAARAAESMKAAGAGEILLTSIEREGTMQGYDLDLIRSVAGAVDIPVIAHGGCRGYEDMAAAIEVGASAVAAGALFQFTDATPRGAAKYLQEHGIEARV